MAFLAAAPLPAVKAVRLTTIDFRPALRILVSEDMPAGSIAREGEDVVLRLPGVAPETVDLPRVEPPLEDLRLEPSETGTVLRVRYPPGLHYEASQEPGMVTVVFGAPPSPEERGPVTPELYRLLFPVSVMEEEKREGELQERAVGREADGISVGRLVLRPYATVGYVDADILAFDTTEPTRARYLQVAPGVTATMPLMTGRFAAEYEPRMRFFSNIEELGTTSHFAGARYDFPLGSRTLVRVGHRYTRAVLETTIVDPGREYFYNLAPYHFNDTSLAARVEVGPSLNVDLDADFRWTRFDRENAGFFDYDAHTFGAGLGYDLRSDLRATVSYAYDAIPAPPQRPLAESRGHSVLATLAGQIGPLTSGTLTGGLRHQTNPLAVAGGESFTGFVLGGGLRRQMGYRSTLGLDLRRSADPSGFEDNPYYVNNQATLSLDVPIPFEMWLRGSLGYLRNSYPTVSATAGVKRRDEMWMWTVGVGRQLGTRTWIRADYRRESRTSNIPGLDITIDGFLIQLGIGRMSGGVAY